MATETSGVNQRPQIGDKPIVTCHQLVELARGRCVLILKRRRASRFRVDQRPHDRVVDAAQYFARSGEEPDDGREAVRDGARRRAPQCDRLMST